ncbi:MAG: YceI family protein [Bacteroidetes bacterium]|nr:YceI family protein [Bacteroidota bacterium]
MKNIKLTLALATILFASAFTFIQSVNWKVKEGYTVKFTGKKVDGIFKGLKAEINFNEKDPGKSKILASIDATTANTGSGIMNKHAKSEDGLNTEKFPTINFESSEITKMANGFLATGKLTLRGVTKEIKFPFTFANDTFNGKFAIAPKEYGVTRNGTPDEITIELNIPVTK